MTPPPDDAVAALLAELQESPLPGSRYAYTVVKRHAAGWSLTRREEREALVALAEGALTFVFHDTDCNGGWATAAPPGCTCGAEAVRELARAAIEAGGEGVGDG